MYIGRIVVMFVMLIVVGGAATWGGENDVGLRCDGAGKAPDCAVMQSVSAEAPPATAPTAAERNETTPPTELTAPAKPADEENQEKTCPQSQLDLDALERRIRQTDALGFFTKLFLKNQVDDLLSQFRAYYKGKNGLTLEQLRENYNLLLLKLVSLLEDGDPQLSQDILTSRGAIWHVLADPEQFAKLQES